MKGAGTPLAPNSTFVFREHTLSTVSLASREGVVSYYPHVAENRGPEGTKGLPKVTQS